MSAPLVVNTADGTVWTRRGELRGGESLYAPEGVCSCPPFVMATLAELAEHGIAGSADALPVPVGPQPSDREKERAAIAELIGEAKPASDGLLVRLGESVRDRREHEHPTWEDLFCLNLTSWAGERMGSVLRRLLDAEARVEQLLAERHSTNEALSDTAVTLHERETAPLTVYRASHDSIVMGLYTTREAAQQHCEAKVRQEEPKGSIRGMSWVADGIGPDAEYELHITPAGTGELIRGTGYVVTPLEVTSQYDEGADE